MANAMSTNGNPFCNRRILETSEKMRDNTLRGYSLECRDAPSPITLCPEHNLSKQEVRERLAVIGEAAMEHLHNGNKQSESSGCFYMKLIENCAIYFLGKRFPQRKTNEIIVFSIKNKTFGYRYSQHR